MKRNEIEKSVEIVRKGIFRINPFNLLEHEQDDELDSEILSIASQLQRCRSGRDVSHAIARVLNSAFSEKFQPEEFEHEGSLIYQELLANGIK
ncbi:MAG: hypothetical protein ACWA5R_08990 [bacterium]